MGEAKTTRTRRTAAERAEAELATAKSVLQRLEGKAGKLAEALEAAHDEIEEARQRVEYASKNPALGDAKPYSIDGSYDADDYSDAEVEQRL